MRALMIGCSVVAPLILVLSNVLNTRVDIALVSLGVGLLWLAGQWRNWPGVNSVAFAGMVALAGVTVGMGGVMIPALLALITAIIAWDLGHLEQQMFNLGLDQVEPLLLRLHMRRLIFTAGLGVLVPLLGLSVQIGLTMVWAIVLGIIITVSLSLTISFIRRFGENG